MKSVLSDSWYYLYPSFLPPLSFFLLSRNIFWVSAKYTLLGIWKMLVNRTDMKHHSPRGYILVGGDKAKNEPNHHTWQVAQGMMIPRKQASGCGTWAWWLSSCQISIIAPSLPSFHVHLAYFFLLHGNRELPHDPFTLCSKTIFSVPLVVGNPERMTNCS